jgi:hypothetical protein
MSRLRLEGHLRRQNPRLFYFQFRYEDYRQIYHRFVVTKRHFVQLGNCAARSGLCGWLETSISAVILGLFSQLKV